MGNVHSTVTFEHISGQPEDRVVNTFSFLTPAAPTDFDLGGIEAALNAFYNVIPATGTTAVGKFLSPSLSRAIKPVIRHYDVSAALTGGVAGSPIKVADMAAMLTAPSSTNGLPGELAIALSYKSDYLTDVEFGALTRPRARDRGRIYLGPLINSAYSYQTIEGRGFIDATAQNQIALAGASLIASTDASWAVWSRRNGTFKTVTSVWVDDDFDIQRRRGNAAKTRVVKP